jgi:hypothetical protein
MLPSLTAAMAGSARGFILTNHCSLISGSMTLSQREHWPTAWVCGSILSR